MNNILSERGQRHGSQLKMLLGERNSDDGDEENNTKQDMGEADPDTANENPKYVEQNIETAVRPFVSDHLFAERPKRQPSQLEGLNPEWNPDDGDHHQYA